MNTNLSRLAFAQGNFEDAKIVVFGVPFDATASFIPGARFGPAAIRTASWNLEDYVLDLGRSVDPGRVHDMGDIDPFPRFEDLRPALADTVKGIVRYGKIPMVLGGEHTITPVIVEGVIEKRGKGGVIVLDAHLDFRDEYLGDRWSHACTIRRLAEVVGVENILLLGVRSGCHEEVEEGRNKGLKYITAEDAIGKRRETMERIKSFAEAYEHIYLSLDVDAVDPAYAPGVGTPEPYGLEPRFVRDVVDAVAVRCSGIDIVEVLGLTVGGDMATSTLAAELLRRFIALRIS